MSKLSFYDHRPKAERGITLVISVVLMASVTFISFSISTLLLREIMATRLVLQTEPAISGANSGGEVALFRLLRGAGNVGTTGTLAQSNVNFQVDPRLYDIPYTFSIPAGGTLTIALYDAENPDNLAAGYGYLRVINNASQQSRPINFQVVSWGEPDETICSKNLGTSQEYVCTALTRSDDRYLITIQNTSGSGTATGAIHAYSEDGQEKGVPSSSPDMRVTGQSGNAVRKIEINLQTP